MASQLGARWRRITQSRRVSQPPTLSAPADRWQRVIAWSTAVLAITTGLPAAVTAYQVRTANEATQQQLQLGREQQALAERGQVTDRFSTATEQLASDKIAVRLGGIYALDKIMRDVPDYQAPAIEVLAAFVRLNARSQASPVAGDRPDVPTDIQAALTVLTNRVRRLDDPPIDLSGADLAGADLFSRLDLPERPEDSVYGGHLESARLVGTNLAGAMLVNVSLYDAQILGADMSEALLTSADLRTAQIGSTNLTHANLALTDMRMSYITNSDLRFADLGSSNLEDARIDSSDLRGSDLHSAWLSELMLNAVKWDKATQWPMDLYPAIRAASVVEPNGLFVVTLRIPKQEPRPGLILRRTDPLSNPE